MNEPVEPNHGGAVPPPSFDLPPVGRPARAPLPQPGANARPPAPTPSPSTAPPSAPLQAAVNATSKPGRWKIPVAVLAVLGLGVGSFAVARTVASRSSGATVQLVAADETGSHPFTEDASSVSRDDVSILIDGTADVGVVEAAAPTDGDSSGLTPVTADRSVLYGQGAAPVCDVDALLSGLADDDRVRSAWADLMGVDDGAVESTVRSLTPLVLARDTAVTNTAYEEGQPRRFQAVLQAGTAVLVDQYGVPRVKCSCGNPLLPPDQDGDVTFEGTRWERFDPTAVVRVVQTRSAATGVPAVDLVTNQRTTAALGGSVSLDGYLFDDADGVFVVGADGTRTQVLDHPVAAVFDDGAGGLIYQRLRTGAGLCFGCGSGYHLLNTSPADAAEATIWHLQAAATEPRALLAPPADPARNWQVIEVAGELGGERVLVYTNVRWDPSLDVMDEGHHQASTVIRNLDTGEERTLHDWASTWEEPPGPFRLGDGLLLEDWSYVGPTYALYDAELTRLESSCDGDPEPEIDTCPSLAALVGAEEIVGIDWNDDGSQRGLVRRHLFTGAELAVIALPDLDGYARDLELDVHEGRGLLSVPTHAEARPFTLEVDLASGEVTELDLPGRARWLRAPLLRPRPPGEPPVTSAEPTTPEPVYDVEPSPDCQVRYLDFYEPESDNLAGLLPWDEIPGSAVFHRSTSPSVRVQLRGDDGELREATLAELSEVLGDIGLDGDGRRFVLCGPNSGVERIVQSPTVNPIDDGTTMTIEGLGPARVGASLGELEVAVGLPLQVHTQNPEFDGACQELSFDDGSGVQVLATDEVIGRVEVTGDSPIRTDRDVGIGSTDADVRAAYGDDLTVEPHPYVDGTYLIHRPDSPGNRQMIFETESGVVTSFRVGDDQTTPWIEGCL